MEFAVDVRVRSSRIAALLLFVGAWYGIIYDRMGLYCRVRGLVAASAQARADEDAAKITITGSLGVVAGNASGALAFVG